jgi:hypothetical protein
MKPIVIINSFKSVNFDETKKPIVICDIDHTLIQSKYDYSFFHSKFKKHYTDLSKLDYAVRSMIEKSIKVGDVKSTDKEGFLAMLEKIKNLDGKIVLLTARSYLFHSKTVNDLKTAGFDNPELFEIHYTSNKISKGDYIKKNNLLQGYDYPVFIDDFPFFLNSALQIYPDMNCYLFKYN